MVSFSVDIKLDCAESHIGTNRYYRVTKSSTDHTIIKKSGKHPDFFIFLFISILYYEAVRQLKAPDRGTSHIAPFLHPHHYRQGNAHGIWLPAPD